MLNRLRTSRKQLSKLLCVYFILNSSVANGLICTCNLLFFFCKQERVMIIRHLSADKIALHIFLMSSIIMSHEGKHSSKLNCKKCNAHRETWISVTYTITFHVIFDGS